MMSSSCPLAVSSPFFLCILLCIQNARAVDLIVSGSKILNTGEYNYDNISPPILVVSDPFERCNKNKSPDGRFWSSRAASTLRFVHPAIQKAPTSCTGEDPTRYAPESSNFHSRLLHGRKIGSSETSGAYNRLDVWHDGWRSCIFLQLDVEYELFVIYASLIPTLL